MIMKQHKNYLEKEEHSVKWR